MYGEAEDENEEDIEVVEFDSDNHLSDPNSKQNSPFMANISSKISNIASTFTSPSKNILSSPTSVNKRSPSPYSSESSPKAPTRSGSILRGKSFRENSFRGAPKRAPSITDSIASAFTSAISSTKQGFAKAVLNLTTNDTDETVISENDSKLNIALKKLASQKIEILTEEEEQMQYYRTMRKTVIKIIGEMIDSIEVSYVVLLLQNILIV